MEIKAIAVMRHFLIVIGSASLTGCLIVPKPEISEIRDSKLEFIEPGLTTRRALDAELLSGDVFIARISGPYTIYAEYRDSFMVVVPNNGYVAGDVDDYLVVEFDEYDTVVRFDRLRSEGECTSYGLCVRGGSKRSRDVRSRRDPDSLVVYAPTQDDAALKEFKAIQGTCSVYAYTDGDSRCNSAEVDVANVFPPFSSNQQTRADVDGYFQWSVPVIGRTSASGTLFARKEGRRLSDLQYVCREGELLFIEIQLYGCGMRTPRANFTSLSNSEGEEQISQRRLILR